MSAEDTVADAAGAISADRFIEIGYDEVIPNNVALGSDKQLQRALESWRPKYLDWWSGMGPVGYQTSEVYLRTAVGVDPAGWAKFGYVKMPAYRWGVLLAPKVEGRAIPFGRHKGEPAWQEVPGEHRALLRRLIVVQGDTEPASVEQQRFLGQTAPSLYDMRNLFQVNVEEGRHLWAMVYLLVKYFGKDGREEAQALLERQSGQMDNPRILGAFNERTPDWLPEPAPSGFSRWDPNEKLSTTDGGVASTVTEALDLDDDGLSPTGKCPDPANDDPYYNPVNDPLKISNLANDLLQPLQKALASVSIRHIVLIQMESQREELFPLQYGSGFHGLLMKSHDELDFDAAKSHGSGKLLNSYQKDGKQFGELNYKIALAVNSINMMGKDVGKMFDADLFPRFERIMRPSKVYELPTPTVLAAAS